MKLIPVGKDSWAKVDDKDFTRLNTYRWYAYKKGHTVYARRFITRTTTVSMHKQLLPNTEVDHHDRNGLNNQRKNLRPCSRSNNLRNRRGYGKSKYKGVCAKGKKWAAYINTDGTRTYLGTFKTQIDAAIVYNSAAKRSGNKFFTLNHIPKKEART